MAADGGHDDARPAEWSVLQVLLADLELRMTCAETILSDSGLQNFETSPRMAFHVRLFFFRTLVTVFMHFFFAFGSSSSMVFLFDFCDVSSWQFQVHNGLVENPP